jgi:hypothetical protein
VRTELLPKLSSHVDAWRDNHDREEDPDSYFSPLVSALRDYRAVFSDLDHEVQHIDAALAEIEETLEQLRSDMPREPDLEDIYGDRMTGTSSDDSRSIFDDVDS